MNNFCTPANEDKARKILGNIVWYNGRIIGIFLIMLVIGLMILLTISAPVIVFTTIGGFAVAVLLFFIHAWYEGDFNLCSGNKNNNFESRWKKTMDGEPYVWVGIDHIQKWMLESQCEPDSKGGWRIADDASSQYMWHVDSITKEGRWIPRNRNE
jgi:hypothetical protein